MSGVSRRAAAISPFRVMAILARARELEAAGRSIIHMEIGEPDFPTPAGIVQAGIQALHDGQTHYTPALGLPALRQAIAASYPSSAGLTPRRVAVTPGASGALQLALASLLDPGDEVLLADPGYPCNRHLVQLLGGQVRAVPVDAGSRYQLTAELIARHWSERTVAVLLASPSNPTGTLVPAGEWPGIIEVLRARGGALIVDEIYQGLVYAQSADTVLRHTDQAFVINSFSKYYGMTGWRLGWLVAPETHVEAVDRLAQNLFIAAATPSQHAALAAFTPAVAAELEQRRQAFEARRDFLLPALEQLGFRVPVQPGGAFYIYADCSGLAQDAEAFARALLEDAGVALTPGNDFGDFQASRYVRFSYASTLESLQEGVRRIGDWLAAHPQGSSHKL